MAKLRLEMLEMDVEERRQKLAENQERIVDIDELERRIGPAFDEVRIGAELLHRWPEAQRVMVEHLNHAIDRLNGNGINGIKKSESRGRQGRRSPGRKAKTKGSKNA